jgi:hypothetical protein
MSDLLDKLWRDFWHWEDGHRIWHGWHRGGHKSYRPAATLLGKNVLVSRAVLAEKLGRPIAHKMQACHKTPCDRYSCVEPTHLYEGTASQNIRDIPREVLVRLAVNFKGKQ